MEVFSLLKYWRGSGTANVRTAAANVRTTIAASVLRSTATESSSSDEDEDEDEGSFFDLEFSANRNEGETMGGNCDSSSESENEEEDVEKSSDNNLLFKGQLLPLEVEEESPSIVITSSVGGDNNRPPHFSVSLLKSAAWFRILMLGLKKPKPCQSTSDQNPNTAVSTGTSPNRNKFFIKFNVDEVPIVSLFAREIGSRKNEKTKKVVENQEEDEEKKLNAASKETVQKYISKIKPLYVRVSKRYGEKLRLSGLLTAEDEAAVRSPPAGMRIVRKKWGKSKSTVAAVASPTAVSQRRDDSLLQQEDGIQSAIAHCKMTLKAAKGLQSPLMRSKSDPTDDRSEKANVVL